MAHNEPQRKETPPGPSPNSPSLLFEYQCRSGKFIRLANRIKSKKNRFGSENRIESKLFFARIGMLYGAASSSSNARENVELVRPSDTLRLRTATPGTLSDCDVTAFPASSAAAAARTTSGCSGACTRGGHVSETRDSSVVESTLSRDRDCCCCCCCLRSDAAAATGTCRSRDLAQPPPPPPESLLLSDWSESHLMYTGPRTPAGALGGRRCPARTPNDTTVR